MPGPFAGARRAAFRVAILLLLSLQAGGAAAAREPAGSTTPASAAAPLSWVAESAPFALRFLSHGAPLVAQALSPEPGPGNRMSYELADGSRHTLTSLLAARKTAQGLTYAVATDEPGRTATVAVTATARGVHVDWHLEPATGVTSVFSALQTNAGREHFLGTGINHERVDLNGELVQLKAAYGCGRSIVTPFYASSAGYAVYYETSAVGQIEFNGSHDGMSCGTPNELHPLCAMAAAPDRVQACFETSSLSFDVFAGTPAETVAAYRLTAGRMKPPSAADLGVAKWRDTVAGAHEVLDDIAHFHRLRIPLAAVLVDNPWETNRCLGTLSFDPVRFPDPGKLIREVHAAGLRFYLWVSPQVTTTGQCRRLAGYDPGDVLPSVSPDHSLVDFTSAAARQAYEQRIAGLVRLGVDGFKGDRGDQSDKQGLPFAEGSGVLVHNEYPLLYGAAVVHGSSLAGRARPFTMFRGGDAQTPTVAGVWTGDQTPDFAGLRDAIHSLATLGASGFAFAGSDVGGYSTQGGKLALTSEVFARWTQLGAVSPIFELGGADRASRFWELGPAAISAARDSIVLHDALIPYLLGLEQKSARDGSAVLQPLSAVWPRDEQAWRHDLELLVGRDLLAAPVTSASRRPEVYLPDGAWFDLFAGRALPGGRTVSRVTPLDEFPLYLRAGATIRFDLGGTQLWPRPWPSTGLPQSGRAGWLTTASAVRIAAAPREAEILFAGAAKTRAVRVNGSTVPHLPTVAGLRAAPAGWTRIARPFPGVLVKLGAHHGAVQASAQR